MNVPSFEQAISDKDIFSYEVSRNCLGWQLSFCGEEISVLITKDQAAQIIEKMDSEDESI
jgi:hypothetical protein